MSRLPPIPRRLPDSQADWERFANILQAWGSAIQTHKWIAPTLLNGWVPYGAPYETPGYYQDAGGRVYLRGLVKSGTITSPICTLPVAPPAVLIVPAISVDALCEVRVDTSGNVTVTSGGSSTWVSLSNISFDTTP